jgi:GGDEF domain-containing protein
MRRNSRRFLLTLLVIVALLALGFATARGASFAAQNSSRVGFLAAVVTAAVVFSWSGALLAALAAGALSTVAMQEALRAGASTRAPFLSALLLDSALFFGVGILAALLVHDRRGLEEMAFCDEASGLLLWPRLLEKLGEEVRRARGDASPLALLIIEAEDVASQNFEATDDAARRQRELASLVAQCARAEDIAGLGPPRHVTRFAGTKKSAEIVPRFAVVLPRTSNGGAQVLAERILEAARRHTRLTGETHSLSCGIALMSLRASQQAPGAAELVEHAEEALSEAQRTGSGRIVFFDAEMRAH